MPSNASVTSQHRMSLIPPVFLHSAVSQVALQVSTVLMKIFGGIMVVFILVMVALGTVSYFQDQVCVGVQPPCPRILSILLAVM